MYLERTQPKRQGVPLSSERAEAASGDMELRLMRPPWFSTS